MLEAIFENNHGIFEFDSETRLFTLRDQKSTPKIFLGSVDPNAETGYGTLSEIIKLGIVRYFLSDKIKKGSFVGFVPDFIVGYLPFGVVCTSNNISSIKAGEINISYSKRANLANQLGSEIKTVYHQLTDAERGYPIIR